MDGFGGVIIVRRKFNKISNGGRRVGLLRHLESGPWSTMGGKTTEYVGSFQTLLIDLESAEGFESGGQVAAGSCCVSLGSGGMDGHNIVDGGDFA